MEKSKAKSDDDTIKMCIDKLKSREEVTVKKVAEKVANKRDIKDTKKLKKKMRAAFLKSKIWSSNSTINVGFFNTFNPEKIPRTSTAKMKREVDRNGIALKLDPIQEEVDDMPIISAIIYTVCKRFNDVIHPEHKPKSVTIDPSYVPKPLINLKFNFFDPNDKTKLFNPNLADIRISFDPEDGAWSYLGTDILTYDKTEPTMNFAWFDVPTILHEFCHAVGMVHEHSNPNGKPINWAVCHVTSWANKNQGWNAETIKENIVEKYKVDQINGSEFDPLSIMLYFYPGKVICKENPDGSVEEITLRDVQNCFGDECPKNHKACREEETRKCDRPGKGTTQNQRFSPFDVLYLNNIYIPNDQTISAETFTVNFFQDVYSEQIKPEELTKQLEMTKEREKKTEKYEDPNLEAYSDAEALEDIKEALKIAEISSKNIISKLSDVNVQVILSYIILCIFLVSLIIMIQNKTSKAVFFIILLCILYFQILPNIDLIKAIVGLK